MLLPDKREETAQIAELRSWETELTFHYQQGDGAVIAGAGKPPSPKPLTITMWGLPRDWGALDVLPQPYLARILLSLVTTQPSLVQPFVTASAAMLGINVTWGNKSELGAFEAQKNAQFTS